MKLNGKLIEDPLLSNRIGQYVSLRQAIRNHEKKIKEIKATQEKVAASILEIMQGLGLQSVRTDRGGAYQRMSTTASLSDPDSFMEFVKTNNAFELMDRKANAVACREFAETHGNLPPGVKLNQTMGIGVQSPADTGETE